MYWPTGPLWCQVVGWGADYAYNNLFTLLINAKYVQDYWEYLFNFNFNFLGVLILSLDKDTYELLGLTGKASAFQKKHRFSEYGFK